MRKENHSSRTSYRASERASAIASPFAKFVKSELRTGGYRNTALQSARAESELSSIPGLAEIEGEEIQT